MPSSAIKPGCYAAIFSSQRTDQDARGYEEMSKRMEALAKTMPGYLGIESARDENGFGITVSYWESEEAIANWKKNANHAEAQHRGKVDWYKEYSVRVAKVERAYEMKKQR
ncbi:antibiotic biosynthesis monooxygenase [Hyphococcus formosus]|uniref:antibiotic biosynthesis monooxygenase family protein n=1 Tax=Hyphococcus formosus TaxID=3143534 RepID=UPI00398B09E9